MVTVDTLRVAIVADLLAERWPSMDLVADMLMSHVGAGDPAIETRLLRPAFGAAADGPAPPTIQRIAHRFWSYPRWLRRQPEADVYHVVDHSYAHLVHELPAARVVVTCHDTDAFKSLLTPEARESNLPRWLVKRVLAGLQQAAAVVCDSEYTRKDLLSHGLAHEQRTTVLPIGVDPICSSAADAVADAAAARLTGPVGPVDILHVGSTIPRKRIDVLLEAFAAIVMARPDARLWRVGGPFTPQQERQAQTLGIRDRIVVMPFVTRPVLAAIYRRAALVLLTSDREGFGLPVLEAMACGTPVLCSDLPVLHEVGGEAAAYCTVADVPQWRARILELLAERTAALPQWTARRHAGLRHASVYSWARYADGMQRVYERLAEAR